jgi:hypothetical protein
MPVFNQSQGVVSYIKIPYVDNLLKIHFHCLKHYIKGTLTAEINNLSSASDCSQSNVNVNSHIDLLSVFIYYKSQIAM